MVYVRDNTWPRPPIMNNDFQGDNIVYDSLRGSCVRCPAPGEVPTMFLSTLSSIEPTLLRTRASQGFDTVTHALILRDMIRWDEEMVSGSLGLRRALVLLFPIWAIHAIGNLVRDMES